MFSLESPHQGDSNENTKHTISIEKMTSPLIIPNLQLSDFYLGIQEQIRNSCSKRANSVQATEVLLYYVQSIIVLISSTGCQHDMMMLIHLKDGWLDDLQFYVLFTVFQ